MYLHGETVVCRSDTGRQLRLQLGVTGAMSQVCQPRLPRANLLRSAHRLRNAEVSRVRCAEERVQHENVDATKRAQRFLGELLGVGDVPECSNAVSVDGDWSVRNRDG